MSSRNDNTWTRRRFLTTVGQAGGSAALYETMTALGLINVPAAWAGPPELSSGQRRSVIVLGSGVGGLTTAYLLRKAGCRVRILEAQARAGGRSLTARRDTVIEEESAQSGSTQQVCKFDEGLYLNMGPGRIPHHHHRVLHYCKELGVPLEVFVMRNAATLFQSDKAFQGEAQPRRRIAHDTRGFIAELLAKAVNNHALDEALDPEDKDRLLDLLKTFGALGRPDCDGITGPEDLYAGSIRAGIQDSPSVERGPCPATPTLELQELLRSEFWQRGFYGPTEYDWQGTLFQPIGGMDQIVQGFLRAPALRNRVRFQAEVKSISIRQDEVRVTYNDLNGGGTRHMKADACVSNIPLPLLEGIIADGDSNVSPGFREAVGQMSFSPSVKIGWQANQRFWEHEDQIYGGISWLDHPITQMWYPSNDYFSRRGTVLGSYTFGDVASVLGEMTLSERLAAAREGGALLHPQFNDHKMVPQSRGLSVAWQNVPYQRGAFPHWEDTPVQRDAYQRLLAADQPGNPRLWVVGDQVASLGAWQEGAMMSAEWVAQQVTGAIPSESPQILRVPEARYLIDSLP